MKINKTINVAYKTKEEFRKLLQLLEDKGWNWNSGHNPLYFLHEYYNAENPESLEISKDKKLMNGFRSEDSMTYNQFIKKYVEIEVIVNGEVYV